MPLFRFSAPKKPLPFMRWRYPAFAITGLLMIATIGSMLFQGLNLGVDFTGGTVIEVRSAQAIDIAGLREGLGGAGFTDAAIQGFEEDRGATIRLPPSAEGTDSEQTIRAVTQALPQGVSVSRTDILGPRVSGEFLRNSILAVALSIIAMGIYVWFRFEFKFGVATFLTTLHDALLVFGLFSVTRMTFDMTAVAAILAVAGYSINDTVVVADRIRENLRKYKSASLSEIIDRSVTETLPRTMVTSGTTLFASIALMVFGGPVLFSFGAAITFGIAVGSLSSVFVAAPMLIHLPGRMPGEEGRNEAADAEATA